MDERVGPVPFFNVEVLFGGFFGTIMFVDLWFDLGLLGNNLTWLIFILSITNVLHGLWDWWRHRRA